MLELFLALTVTLQWTAPNPGIVSQWKVYKGTSVTNLTAIGSVPSVANQTNYSYDYNFTDASPQLFGVSAVNSFGESSIMSQDAQGNPVLLGKPSPPSALSWLVKP